MQKEKITDKYGNEYSSKVARFLGNLNNEIKQMDHEAKMLPINIAMKKDSMGEGISARFKKILSVFKRKKNG